MEENKTKFNELLTDSEELKKFKTLMEDMYLQGLRKTPTFTPEMHQKIEEEFQKMYKEAEKYYASKNADYDGPQL